MKNIVITLIMTMTFLTSCSYYAYHIQTGSSKQVETNPEVIKIYSGNIEQDYIVIGSVTADVMGDAEDAAEYLKKEAAKLGADAIIKVELTKLTSFSQRTGISGVAIKLR